MQQSQAPLKEVHFDKSTHGGSLEYFRQCRNTSNATQKCSLTVSSGEQHWLVSGPGRKRHNMTYLSDESSKARQSRGQGQEISKGRNISVPCGPSPQYQPVPVTAKDFNSFENDRICRTLGTRCCILMNLDTSFTFAGL